MFAGMSGRFADLTEQPCDNDDKSGFEELRRLDVDADQHKPAPRSLDLGPEIRRRGHHDQTRDKHDQRQAADLARAEKATLPASPR